MSRKLNRLTPRQIVERLGRVGNTRVGEWGAAHHAAVLVPLLMHDAQWHLLLTKRTDILATHKGQISFPGGRAETGDRTPEDTALRETREEVGIADKYIEVAGKLDPFVTHYGISITPVVGFLQWPVAMTLSTDEVSRVLTAPLAWFADPDNLETRIHVEPDGFQRPVYYYVDYNGDTVWGITAHIIDSLIQSLGLK